MQNNNNERFPYRQNPVREALEADINRAFDVLMAAGTRPSRLPKDHPAIQQFAAAWRALNRHDFGPPKRRVYSVAAFAGPPSNLLQGLGRDLYYSKPSRYRVLLPLLGAVVPARPGTKPPGWFRMPVATA